MPQKPNTPEELQQAVDLYHEHGNFAAAADAIQIPYATLKHRWNTAVQKGYTPNPKIQNVADRELKLLRRKHKILLGELKAFEAQEHAGEELRRKILKIAEFDPDPPKWVQKPMKVGSAGTPSILCSDWHWAEVIKSIEIGGVPNEYNLKIAHRRANNLFNTVVHLLTKHTVNPKYDGIVVMLGGDMFSGTLHDLSETNEVPMMKAFLDLYQRLLSALNFLLEVFDKVHVVGVVGNHGRTSMKPKTKQRAATNFDWLLYNMLEAYYHPAEGKVDKRITFNIPESADVRVEIYNHRYLFTHGDQFRGGDGIIGPLGPITRGDVKKRARNMQIGQDYDTLVCGHWHRYLPTLQTIVNGSLCGYNEYAFLNNFTYEPPIQALWFTHPDRGIIRQDPIYV